MISSAFFYLMQWLNSDKARNGRPKIQPLNPNPHTFANNIKIITWGGGGVRKLQIVPTRDICEFCIFVGNSVFTFICYNLFFFSIIFFVLQVFTWVGLWKSHPTLCIPQILMSHIRSPSALTGNQGGILYRVQKEQKLEILCKKKK